MEQQLSKGKSIPTISINDNTLTISIGLEELIWIIENRTDENYEVVDKENLLAAFKFQLENHAQSNATELGISELQYLFDELVDNVATDSEVIEIKSYEP